MRMNNKRGSFSLIGILLAVLIVGWMAMSVLKNYYKPSQGDAQTQKALEGTGLKTTTYKSALDSAKDQLGGVSQQLNEQGKGIEQAGQ